MRFVKCGILKCLNVINISSRLRHSYILGKTSEPLVPHLISDLIERNAINCPQKIACISRHQNLSKTYLELNKDANKLAKVLKDLGCERGTRVGIWAHNRYEWLVTQFATAKLGSVLVNVNPGYKMHELKYCLDLVECHTLISSQRVKTSNYYEILQTLMPSLSSFDSTQNIQTDQVKSLRNIVMLDHPEEPASKNFLRFNELISTKSDENFINDNIFFDDAVNIQFTSGTTGHPKGATVSHHNIVNNAKIIGSGFMEGIENEPQVICCQVPLYHAFGCVGCTLVSAINQGIIVLPSEMFDPNESLRSIEEFKCNFIYGTPTMFVDLLNTSKPITEYNTQSVLRGVMAGTTCPPELMKALHQSIPTLQFIHIVYGTTELSPAVTMTLIGDSEENRFDTVGKAIDHTEIKVVDPKNEDVLAIGERGEILARGYCTFMGYWNQLDKTKEVMTNTRWYRTGDIGTIDENGYLRICGRIKEMIIRGGENIYPREIEELLMINPIIAEVHVVGVEDKRMGEELCAFIRLKSGQNDVNKSELRNYYKDKISHFKIPRFIEFVDDYPRTVTGKVQKFVLKQMAAKMFNS